ncbi:MAG: class I SAM-dependent methyltransferase [Micropepsaceae bacterium]
MMAVTELDDPKISSTLRKLHALARGDVYVFARALPAVLMSVARGKPAIEGALPYLKDAYIPVDPDQGKFLYVTARAINAKTIVEFGTSFGISTIYLAAAARANSGRVIGTELVSAKVKAARANVAQAGLAQFVDIREGDAMKTLASLDQTIDLLLLDGWKDIYLPMIKMLAPKMRAGAVVLADNIFTFKTALRPYVSHMQNRENGFESVTLPLGHGMEYSVRCF